VYVTHDGRVALTPGWGLELKPAHRAVSNGPRKVLVIWVQSTGKCGANPCSRDDATKKAAYKAILTGRTKYNHGYYFWKTNTRGAVLLDFEFTETTCNMDISRYSQALTCVNQGTPRINPDMNKFAHVVYVMPKNLGMASGFGTLGGPYIWIKNRSPFVFNHELGHNFGFRHAGKLGGGEYSDRATVMGFGQGLHAWNLFDIGVLKEAQIKTISSSAPVKLGSLSSNAPTGYLAARIQDHDTGNVLFLHWRELKNQDVKLAAEVVGKWLVKFFN
jgi:hypothetical protein